MSVLSFFLSFLIVPMMYITDHCLLSVKPSNAVHGLWWFKLLQSRCIEKHWKILVKGLPSFLGLLHLRCLCPSVWAADLLILVNFNISSPHFRGFTNHKTYATMQPGVKIIHCWGLNRCLPKSSILHRKQVCRRQAETVGFSLYYHWNCASFC